MGLAQGKDFPATSTQEDFTKNLKAGGNPCRRMRSTCVSASWAGHVGLPRFFNHIFVLDWRGFSRGLIRPVGVMYIESMNRFER